MAPSNTQLRMHKKCAFIPLCSISSWYTQLKQKRTWWHEDTWAPHPLSVRRFHRSACVFQTSVHFALVSLRHLQQVGYILHVICYLLSTKASQMPRIIDFLWKVYISNIASASFSIVVCYVRCSLWSFRRYFPSRHLMRRNFNQLPLASFRCEWEEN